MPSRRVVSGLSAWALPLGRTRTHDDSSPLRARLPNEMCSTEFFLPELQSLDTDLTRNTRAPHFTPQHWLLCHIGLY